MMYVVLILLFCLPGLGEAAQDEAACYSRFDYESKMLERIVMVEHRMNLLQENTKRDIDTFQIAIKRMKKEQTENFQAVTKKFDLLQNKLQTAQGTALTQLTAAGDDVKNVSDTLLSEYRVNQDKLDAKFENMSQYLKDELSKNQKELVSDVKAFTDGLEAKNSGQLDTMTAVEYDMKELGENLKEEQSLKLQALEAVGMDIKVDMQERMLKLEEADRCQAQEFAKTYQHPIVDMQERMLKLEEADRCQAQEFAKTYQEFEETVNNTWTAIKVSGLGIKPAVVFNIRDVTDTRPSSGSVLRFSYVLTNTDNVYNISNGMFTAPVNGTYWFSVQLCGTSNGQVGFRIVLNSQELSDTTTIQQYNTCTTSNAVVNLHEGDQVCVKVEHSHGYRSYRYSDMITSTTYVRSAFMGTLIH